MCLHSFCKEYNRIKAPVCFVIWTRVDIVSRHDSPFPSENRCQRMFNLLSRSLCRWSISTEWLFNRSVNLSSPPAQTLSHVFPLGGLAGAAVHLTLCRLLLKQTRPPFPLLTHPSSYQPSSVIKFGAFELLGQTKVVFLSPG